jgi:20S proteasome alpha/beta subunit
MSLHQYTESGEVAQISYASQAIQKSSIALLGFSLKKSAVIFAVKRKLSKLQVIQSKPIIEVYSKSLGIAMSGNPADSEYTRIQCNIVKQLHILRFGEIPSIDYIATTMSKWLTRGMYVGEDDVILRPIATALILFGRDAFDDTSRLILVENSGSVKECNFASVGNLPGGQKTLDEIRKVLQLSDIGSIDNKEETKENIREKLISVVQIMLTADEMDGEDQNENESDFTIDCSVVDGEGISSSGSFSSLKSFEKLLSDGWMRDVQKRHY